MGKTISIKTINHPDHKMNKLSRIGELFQKVRYHKQQIKMLGLEIERIQNVHDMDSKILP